LSHPTFYVFNFLVSKNKIPCTSRCSLTQCQAYVLGKSSCLLLKPTSHKTTTPFDLIFSDVRSPASIFSSEGFRYFFIFIDAHTKHIWYYPLIMKFDVFSTFHLFQVLVERQFSWNIKYVQTNWGGEYHKLNSFFQTISIHHHLIFPHTHEQNGTYLSKDVSFPMNLTLVALGVEPVFLHFKKCVVSYLRVQKKISHIQNQICDDSYDLIKNNNLKGCNVKHKCKGSNC